MIQGFGTDGMFAEYAAIDRHNAIHLPDNLETETSAPYFCAGITGVEHLRAVVFMQTLTRRLQHSTESILAILSQANGWSSLAVVD